MREAVRRTRKECFFFSSGPLLERKKKCKFCSEFFLHFLLHFSTCAPSGTGD